MNCIKFCWLKVTEGADIGLFLQQLLLNVDLQLEADPGDNRQLIDVFHVTRLKKTNDPDWWFIPTKNDIFLWFSGWVTISWLLCLVWTIQLEKNPIFKPWAYMRNQPNSSGLMSDPLIVFFPHSYGKWVDETGPFLYNVSWIFGSYVEFLRSRLHMVVS